MERVKIGNLTVLTDHDWSTVLEASLYAPTTKKLFVEDAALPVLNLVCILYIMTEKISKQGEKLHGKSDETRHA